jgi:hypothetical protein
MKHVFADTSYLVAQADEHDTHHETATAVAKAMGAVKLVTSDMVLTEFMNFFAGRGPQYRQMASKMIKRLQSRHDVQIEPQTRDLFLTAQAFYQVRPDKQWSLTDCASFKIMERLKIDEALTHDRHFEQAGFRVLLRDVAT